MTIDETMARYKDECYLARQYMPKKPIKWRFKIWCVTSANSKFMLKNFF